MTTSDGREHLRAEIRALVGDVHECGDEKLRWVWEWGKNRRVQICDSCGLTVKVAPPVGWRR